MDQFIFWLEQLNEKANELRKLSKCQHEPYDNFGGDNLEIIEIAVENEIERLKKKYGSS